MRGTFQRDSYLARCEERGEEPNKDYVDFYENMARLDEIRQQDPNFKENNLEYDLRTTEWILEKVREDRYAQNLYAALCNNEFQRNDLMPILRDQRWSCSWRYAGGIVADMRERGDYIDWYCSGIRGSYYDGESIDDNSSSDNDQYVSEGTVTDEIRSDLKRLGWLVVDVED